MKAKYFFIILLSFVFSCGNNEDNDKNTPKFEANLAKESFAKRLKTLSP